MSDPRRSNTKAWSIAGGAGALLLLSVALPAVIAFFAAVSSAPFFGVTPSPAERAASASWVWCAFAVSAASVLVIVLLIVANRRRGVSVLAVILVLALCASGVWMVVALNTQRASDAANSTHARTRSPSPAPTIVLGRYLPDARGTASANRLIERLGTLTFPAHAGPAAVSGLIAKADVDNPEARGVDGDVAVGVFVGHRTCVLGDIRAGHATWSVAGLSVDGGCLGPEHS